MNPRLLIPALLVGAVALACGSQSHSQSSVTPSGSEQVVRHGEKKTASAKPAQIRSAFKVNAEPRTLHFAFDVTNTNKKHVELAFPSGQEYEFSVVDSTGKEVYRWGKGRMFTQSLQNRVLDGGETLRIDERAERALPHGNYVAVATLRSSNYPVEERVEFAMR
jgi:hypothetical protein